MPVMCAKFQGDQITCLCFIAIFAKCAKRQMGKKTIKTLAACISEMARAISFKFEM